MQAYTFMMLQMHMYSVVWTTKGPLVCRTKSSGGVEKAGVAKTSCSDRTIPRAFLLALQQYMRAPLHNSEQELHNPNFKQRAPSDSDRLWGYCDLSWRCARWWEPWVAVWAQGHRARGTTQGALFLLLPNNFFHLIANTAEPLIRHIPYIREPFCGVFIIRGKGSIWYPSWGLCVDCLGSKRKATAWIVKHQVLGLLSKRVPAFCLLLGGLGKGVRVPLQGLWGWIWVVIRQV